MSKELELKEEWLQSKVFITDTKTICECQQCDTNRHNAADWWLDVRYKELSTILAFIEGIDDSGGGNGRRLKIQIVDFIKNRME